jgi:regulator of protease activity HflC (stomatin/prohibitin superfamily)
MLESILPAVFENLLAIMPFKIVYSYEKAVRWTLGKNPHEVGPGWVWRIWLLHEVSTTVVVDDVIELPVQSVITADEKLVCFKAAIGYRVVDVVKHACNVTDFIESTKVLAAQHLAKKVRGNTLADLIEDLSKLERSLEGTLTTKFKDWGTEVFMVGFIDFAEVPTQVRIFGSERATLDVRG